MSYRILLNTLTTGTLIAEVRPTAARWDKGLNGVGTASVTAPTDVLLATLTPLRSYLGNTCVTIVGPSGTPEWSGVVWSATVNLNGDTTLNAARLVTVLNRRVVRSTLTYSGVDQATIAAALVNHAQDTSGGRSDRALNISTASVTTHGVTRTRTYLADEAKPLGEALTQLADVDGGFTFDLTPLLGSGLALSHRLDLTYPNTGTASSAVLIHRANCLVNTIAMDATAMLSDVVALGGSGQARLVRRRGGALAGWPCLESVRSWNDVVETATLDAYGDRVLALGAKPAQMPSLQVMDVTAPAPLNSVVRLVVPEVGLDDNYRITATATTLVGEQALSTLTVVNADLYL